MLFVFERAIYIHGGSVVLRVQHYYIRLLGVVIGKLLFSSFFFFHLLRASLLSLIVGVEFVFNGFFASTLEQPVGVYSKPIDPILTQWNRPWPYFLSRQRVL